MWKQMKQEIQKDRFLKWLLLGMTVYAEGGFLLESEEGSQAASSMAIVLCIPCIIVIAISIAFMIRRFKEPEDDNRILSLAQAIVFILYAMLSGAIFFIICWINIRIMRNDPESVLILKGFISHATGIIMGFVTSVTTESAILLFALFSLSAYFHLIFHTLLETAMRKNDIRKESRRLVQACFLVMDVFVIRMVWLLQITLIGKILIMLAICAFLFTANYLLCNAASSVDSWERT